MRSELSNEKNQYIKWASAVFREAVLKMGYEIISEKSRKSTGKKRNLSSFQVMSLRQLRFTGSHFQTRKKKQNKKSPTKKLNKGQRKHDTLKKREC